MGKNSRAGKNKKKTPKAVQQMKIRLDNEATIRMCQNYANHCLSKYQLAELLVLHDKFGFGKIRLARAIEEIIKTGQAIQDTDPEGEEYLLPSDIYNMFTEMYGVEWMEEHIGTFDPGLK